MIESAAQIPADRCLEADICIVGSGVAGLALAHTLMDSKRSVILLEAGTRRFDPATQSFFRGTVAERSRHDPLDTYRRRQFGGASVIWGGQCVPFDPLDFEPRPELGAPGWPIAYESMTPYYERANTFLEAGEYAYEVSSAGLTSNPPLVSGMPDDVLRSDTLERFSCPTDVGARYGGELGAKASIRILLGASATGLTMHADQRTVASLLVQVAPSHRFEVRAKQFVLAMGALETTRFLLDVHLRQRQLIEMPTSFLGSCYMCHIAGDVGEVKMDAAVSHDYERSPNGIYCRRRLTVRPEVQQKLGIGNVAVRLHFPRPDDPAHGSGVLSLAYLGRRLLSYEYAKRLQSGSTGSSIAHLRNIAADLPATSRFMHNWISNRWLARRRYPSVVVATPSRQFSLDIHAEQTPNPSSTVSLSDEIDAFGMRRLHVDWRHSECDEHTIVETVRLVADSFASERLGQVDWDRDRVLADVMRHGAYGGHHIGTARMSRTASDGVVDPNCRVYGTTNLHLATSAVFPTSGQAPPTLTIAAMAIRLGDRLSR